MSNELTVTLLNRMIEQNDAILAKLADNDRRLEEHTRADESVTKELFKAFPKKPDGSPDFEGHEVYHSALIEESRERAKMYRELQRELIKKGMWGILLVLGALIAYWWTGHVVGVKP